MQNFFCIIAIAACSTILWKLKILIKKRITKWSEKCDRFEISIIDLISSISFCLSAYYVLTSYNLVFYCCFWNISSTSNLSNLSRIKIVELFLETKSIAATQRVLKNDVEIKNQVEIVKTIQ